MPTADTAAGNIRTGPTSRACIFDDLLLAPDPARRSAIARVSSRAPVATDLAFNEAADLTGSDRVCTRPSAGLRGRGRDARLGSGRVPEPEREFNDDGNESSVRQHQAISLSYAPLRRRTSRAWRKSSAEISARAKRSARISSADPVHRWSDRPPRHTRNTVANRAIHRSGKSRNHGPPPDPGWVIRIVSISEHFPVCVPPHR